MREKSLEKEYIKTKQANRNKGEPKNGTIQIT